MSLIKHLIFLPMPATDLYTNPFWGTVLHSQVVTSLSVLFRFIGDSMKSEHPCSLNDPVFIAFLIEEWGILEDDEDP